MYKAHVCVCLQRLPFILGCVFKEYWVLMFDHACKIRLTPFQQYVNKIDPLLQQNMDFQFF